jgi:hypothetical protein
MSARSGRALRSAGRHPRAGWCLVDPGDHGSSSTVPAPRLNRPVQRCVESGPGDTGGVIRTAQVTGLFDLWPSSPPCRQVHEGPPQVHRRSARGQRILARRRPARSRFTRGQWPHSAGHAQASRARPAARRGSAMKRHGAMRHSSAPSKALPPVSAGFSRLPADSLSHAGAVNVGPPVIFRAPGGLVTEDGRPSNPGARGSVNRTFGLLVQSDPTTRTGFMIADAVRYMSVHSWTQWDSHGLSRTSSG